MRVGHGMKCAAGLLTVAVAARVLLSAVQPTIEHVDAAVEEAKGELAQEVVFAPEPMLIAQASKQNSTRTTLQPLDRDDPVFGRNVPRLQPIPESIPALPGVAFDDALPFSEPPVDATEVDPEPLRDQLRGLLEEKLQLLTVAELRVEIDRTERTIREIKARDRLEELRHELDRLGRDYPQTWGGNAAQQLLHVPLPARAGEPTDPFSTSPFGTTPSFAPSPVYVPAPVHTPSSPRTVPQRRS